MRTDTCTTEHSTDKVAGRDRQDTLAFANQYRLRVDFERFDDGTPNREHMRIPGKRGELYFDEGKLCLMVLDGPARETTALEAIGGNLWTGDKSPSVTKPGRNVQDVKITGIPLENARLAIRLVGAPPRKIVSEAQKAALAKGVRFVRHDDKSPTEGGLPLDGAWPNASDGQTPSDAA